MLRAVLGAMLGCTGAATAQWSNVNNAATGQPVRVSFELAWAEVLAGSNTPGNGNGMIDPGEGARFTVTVRILDPVGTAVTWPPSSGGTGAGVLRGLANIFIDLYSTPAATGSWSNLHVDPQWDLLGPDGWGNPTLAGATLSLIQAGQFPQNQNSVNTTNPVEAIWSGVWTPASFVSRSVQWSCGLASAGQWWPAANVILQDPTVPNLLIWGTPAVEYQPVTIGIVPAPGAAPVLTCVLFCGGIRRRRRETFVDTERTQS